MDKLLAYLDEGDSDYGSVHMSVPRVNYARVDPASFELSFLRQLDNHPRADAASFISQSGILVDCSELSYEEPAPMPSQKSRPKMTPHVPQGKMAPKVANATTCHEEDLIKILRDMQREIRNVLHEVNCEDKERFGHRHRNVSL